MLSRATQKSEINMIERKYLTKTLQLSRSGVSIFVKKNVSSDILAEREKGVPQNNKQKRQTARG